MLILAIDTATPWISCGVGDAQGTLAAFVARRERRHAETLAPLVRLAVEEAGISLGDISVVAVDIGPGLFTGLRAGIATARALAFARKLPMVGVSSLDLLAFFARHRQGSTFSVVDARRGEVFWAAYRTTPGGVQMVKEPAVSSPEALAAEIVATGSDETHLLVGDGALRHRHVFEETGKVEIADAGMCHPSIDALLALAQARATREEFVSYMDVTPMYLRDPDTRIGWEVRPGVDQRGRGGGTE